VKKRGPCVVVKVAWELLCTWRGDRRFEFGGGKNERYGGEAIEHSRKRCVRLQRGELRGVGNGGGLRDQGGDRREMGGYERGCLNLQENLPGEKRALIIRQRKCLQETKRLHATETGGYPDVWRLRFEGLHQEKRRRYRIGKVQNARSGGVSMKSREI